MIVGITEQGNGLVYNYDAIGSTEKKFGQSGSGMSMISPTLDLLANRYNDYLKSGRDISVNEARHIIKFILNSITQRDIETGDVLQIFIISNKSIFLEKKIMRRD